MNPKRPRLLAALTALAVVVAGATFGLWSWHATDPHANAAASAFGLPPLQLPADVVLDPGRIELGRKLFFDRRLSFNGTMSCAMCHVPEQGFTSHASRTALGIEEEPAAQFAIALERRMAGQPVLRRTRNFLVDPGLDAAVAS